MHMPVMESTPAGSGDITAIIAAETPWVEGLDLALCGMEVPVAPDGVYSGYPAFGTSAEVVAALARSGWDGCATASNHAADRGEAGIVATLDALDAQGLGHAGTYRSQQDASVPFALYELERGGRTVTVAQISTTMDLNGLEDPTGYSVSLNDVGAITKAAKSARAAGADLVVVHSQLGEEYETTPNDKQVSYAQSLADTGQVDILFGAHPHVPQPAEKLSGGVGGKGSVGVVLGRQLHLQPGRGVLRPTVRRRSARLGRRHVPRRRLSERGQAELAPVHHGSRRRLQDQGPGGASQRRAPCRPGSEHGGDRPALEPAHLSGQGRLDHGHHTAQARRTGSDDSQSRRGHQTSRSPPGPAGRDVGLPITTMSRGL